MYVQIRVHECTSAPSFGFTRRPAGTVLFGQSPLSPGRLLPFRLPNVAIRSFMQIPPSPYTRFLEDLCKRPIPKKPAGQNPPLTLKLFFGEFGQSGNQEKAHEPLFFNEKRLICIYALSITHWWCLKSGSPAGVSFS